MNNHNLLGLLAVVVMGPALLSDGASAQQAGPTMHKYLSCAVLTAEGVKNLQKQPPTTCRTK
jgi:hypothetical protein